MPSPQFVNVIETVNQLETSLTHMETKWNLFYEQGYVPKTDVFNKICENLKKLKSDINLSRAAYYEIFESKKEISNLVPTKINEMYYKISFNDIELDQDLLFTELDDEQINQFKNTTISAQIKYLNNIRKNLYYRVEVISDLINALNYGFISRVSGVFSPETTFAKDVATKKFGGIQLIYDATETLIKDYVESIKIDKEYSGLVVFGFRNRAISYPTNLIVFPAYSEHDLEFLTILAHESFHLILGEIESKNLDIKVNSKFCVGDIKDYTSFVLKLKKNQNAITKYLLQEFSEKSEKMVYEYDGNSPPSEKLQEALASEINNVIHNDSLQNKKFVSDLELKHDTVLLIEQDVSAPTHLINRYILANAYPDEIAKERSSWSMLFENEKKIINIKVEMKKILMVLAKNYSPEDYFDKNIPSKIVSEPIAHELMADIYATFVAGDSYPLMLYNYSLPILLDTESGHISKNNYSSFRIGSLKLLVSLLTLEEIFESKNFDKSLLKIKIKNKSYNYFNYLYEKIEKWNNLSINIAKLQGLSRYTYMDKNKKFEDEIDNICAKIKNQKIIERMSELIECPFYPRDINYEDFIKNMDDIYKIFQKSEASEIFNIWEEYREFKPKHLISILAKNHNLNRNAMLLSLAYHDNILKRFP